MEDCPSLDNHHLFVGGLAEGDLPSLPGADIFLGEANRQALNLPGSEDHQANQRLAFYRAVSSPRQSLWLLYPQNEGSSALLPSPFLKNIRKGCSVPPPLTPAPCTIGQLHRHLGRDLALAHTEPEAPAAVELAKSCLGSALEFGVKGLVRGLRLADIRQRLAAPGPYEGVLHQEEMRQSVARRYGAHFPFSITQLETYARCPFLFFAERLLDLSPPRSPEDDLTALERGNLVHHVLYRFFSERRDAGHSPRPQKEEATEALAFLRELVAEVAADMGLEGFFWQRELERIAGRSEDGQNIGLLPRFLALEIDDQDGALPAYFEFSFGSDPQMGLRDESSSQAPFVLADPNSGEAVRLFGKIDRIDRTPSGHFTVVDYKTGQVPAVVADIRRGTSLQLPIYLMAAEALLGELKEGVAGVYYQVRDHEDCGKKGLFANARFKGEVFHSRSRSLVAPEEFRAYLERARDAVIAHVHAIRAGRFHLTRHDPDQVCSFCTYRQICRLDPQRMRALDRADKL